MQFQGTEIEALGYAGIFLGVLLAFEGLRQVLGRKETLNEVRNRRMRMIGRGATASDVLQILKPRHDRWALERMPLIGTLPQALRQAGVAIRPQTFVAACFLGAACMASSPRRWCRLRSGRAWPRCCASCCRFSLCTRSRPAGWMRWWRNCPTRWI